MELDIKTVTGGPLDVNTYVVGADGSNQCVLIDPGAEYAAVCGAVCSRQVTAVLLTHADSSLNLSGVIGAQLTLPEADVLLEDGDKIEEAGLCFEVLHTPGHTPGSVCYQHEKTLFCGDTLFYQGYGRVDLAGGNSLQMALSLKRLLKLPGDVICYPGHGMKTKIAWEREANA